MSEITGPAEPQGDMGSSSVIEEEPQEGVHQDASSDLPVDSASGHETGSQPMASADGGTEQDGGMCENAPQTVPSLLEASMQESVGSEGIEQAPEPPVMKDPAGSAEASTDEGSELEGHHTDASDAAEDSAIAAICPTDDGSDDFGDFEDVEEEVAHTPVALDDAESEDGFGGFEEAPEGSTAEAPRSEGNDVKDSAMVSTSESQWHRLPLTKQAAGSAQDIFFSSKAAFLAQIREMLCPSKPVTAHDSGGDDNWCDLSLDTLIDRLKGTQSPDGFGLSQLAKQASKIGAGQGEVTPIKWEGSKAESRFLSRCPKCKVGTQPGQQPLSKPSEGSAGEGASGNQDASSHCPGVAINIFTASGVVLDTDYVAGSSGRSSLSGVQRGLVENGNHVGDVAGLPGRPFGTEELPSQPALDTSGFGAWATDLSLIPGMTLPTGTAQAAGEASSQFAQAPRTPDGATDLSGRREAASDEFGDAAWGFDVSAAPVSSPVLARPERRASPHRGLNRGGSASPSRLARSSSLVEAESNGSEGLKVQIDSAVDADAPDLSFMLSDTLVLPK